MTIIEKLKEYKNNRNMSYRQLGVLLGYDEATICRWIKGKQELGKKAEELLKLKLNL